LRFYEGVGVGVLKIEESEPEAEVLSTDSTALVIIAVDSALMAAQGQFYV
jgi:hypothetical protein